MKYLKYSISAIVIYLVFIVVLLPANFVLSQLELPKNIKLGMAQGTLWQGRVNTVQYGDLTINNVRWQLQASALLLGKIEIDLVVGQPKDSIRGNGLLGYSFSGVSVEGLTLSAPVAELTKLAPLPYGLIATGKVRLTVSDFSQGQPWCQSLSGKLKLTNSDISSGFGAITVVTAQALLSCDNGDIVAVVNPETNSLGIDAKVVLDTKRNLIINGFVKPPSNASRDFVELLKFTGQPDTRGRYSLKFQQKI
ncbi:MAG: type II secretion system protein N [Gammaproteobacteria bacterium]|nr:type II secretion system protein N [Gammaproteobacteria bacterium]